MSQEARIAHVISARTWRGGEQQAIWLYEDLDKLGVYQVIFCPKGSATENYCIKHQLRFRSFSKGLDFDPFFARNLAKACKEEQLNILHPHGSGGHTLSILSIDLFKNSCSILLHRRVDFPISGSRFSRYKYNHPKIKRILCVSHAIKKIMANDIQNKDLLDVVYDGIDVHRFHHPKSTILRDEFKSRLLSGEKDKVLIGNVAALTQQKDYFTFIDTAAKLQEKGVNATCFAIGDGKQKEELERYAKEKGLEEQLIFTGFRNDIPQILPELDVFLFSSETEGLGTSVLDAFAAGVPVVSTDAGGLPEIVHHLKNGFLAEVKNPEKLAEGVLMILNQPELATEWVKQAKIDVQAFSREKMAEQILNHYKQIIASEKH